MTFITAQPKTAIQDQMDTLSGGVRHGETLSIEKLEALIKAVKESKYYGWKPDYQSLSDSLKMMKRFPNRPGMMLQVVPGSTAFAAVNRCRIHITTTDDDDDFSDDNDQI